MLITVEYVLYSTEVFTKKNQPFGGGKNHYFYASRNALIFSLVFVNFFHDLITWLIFLDTPVECVFVVRRYVSPVADHISLFADMDACLYNWLYTQLATCLRT
jgi:hypothetical protein